MSSFIKNNANIEEKKTEINNLVKNITRNEETYRTPSTRVSGILRLTSPAPGCNSLKKSNATNVNNSLRNISLKSLNI